MKYNIDGIQFDTKKDITEYGRKILLKLRTFPLSGTDESFMKALFVTHPEFKDKVGVGIKNIFVADAIVPDGVTSPPKCFWIERTDGTTVDISFRKCIDAL